MIILGGVLGENGNISQFAEFNVYNDPDALNIVLNLDVEKYLIPINVCRKVFFTSRDFDNIKNGNLSASIKQITKQYIEYYTTDKKHGDFQGGVMYDLLATAFYTTPELFSFINSFIEVSVSGENIGETKEIKGLENNCKIIIEINADELKKKFFEVMNL